VDEAKILQALQRYYLDDITFERVAEEAGLTLHELIEYFNKFELPVVHTEKDVVEGIKKLDALMQKHGMQGILTRINP